MISGIPFSHEIQKYKSEEEIEEKCLFPHFSFFKRDEKIDYKRDKNPDQIAKMLEIEE